LGEGLYVSKVFPGHLVEFMHQAAFLPNHICCGGGEKYKTKQFIPGKRDHQNILTELGTPSHWLSLLVSC